ncbi:hypothetical protein PC120_g6154 [Phytophthora cactorum]|nr:hypothetical protein PC120_g6154 [Phytophthora cactorum]
MKPKKTHRYAEKESHILRPYQVPRIDDIQADMCSQNLDQPAQASADHEQAPNLGQEPLAQQGHAQFETRMPPPAPPTSDQILDELASANNQKQKANPPRFHGPPDEDLELWLFHIEEHFAIYADLRDSDNSRFITTRFRDSDFDYKLLTKLYELQLTDTQQEYTTKFMLIMSMSSIDMPEVVKRWFYQQNLRADSSTYFSHSNPEDLHKTIEYAQIVEDSRKDTRVKSAQSTSFASSTRKEGRGQFGHSKSQCSRPTSRTPGPTSHRSYRQVHFYTHLSQVSYTGPQVTRLPASGFWRLFKT